MQKPGHTVLVASDQDLLVLAKFRTAEIVTPGQFLKHFPGDCEFA